MSKLVEQLKHEHELLGASLGELKSMGITHPEAKTRLLSIKTMLLDHLKKEDDFLYPPLKKAAETDEQLTRRLKHFASEMESISTFALKFFENYTNVNGETDMQFLKDYGRLAANLKQRIGNEETILYQEFDKRFDD